MVTVFYYHTGRGQEYSREFEDYVEARKFYDKMKHVGYYIVSYICNTSSEMMYMERIIK